MAENTTVQSIRVILTILIATVPLWYPRHSFFIKNANSGIEKLQDLGEEKTVKDQNTKVVQKVGELKPDDQGFREISRTLRRQNKISKSPKSIYLIWETNADMRSGFAIGDDGSRELKRVGLVVEYDDGNFEELISPKNFGNEQILELNELQRWVEHQAKERSHYWTTFLVLLWGSITI